MSFFMIICEEFWVLIKVVEHNLKIVLWTNNNRCTYIKASSCIFLFVYISNIRSLTFLLLLYNFTWIQD